MFFDRFREAAARLPAGLLRPGPAADPAAIAAVEDELGTPLPADYASFLRSFDGADLFHESIVIAGVGDQATLSLRALNPGRVGDAGELAFAESAAGDRFLFMAMPGAGGPGAAATRAVIRVRGESDERLRAGSDFTRWLDATVAREQILYGPDGEFAPEVFEPDGEEVVPRVALRQAERALRQDPESAEAHLDRAVALRRLGRDADAAQAIARASELDPDSPWLWFDLGRARLTSDPGRAAEAFRRAAALEVGPAGARMLAWACHAAGAVRDDAAAEQARAAALARQPALLDDLRRAVAAAIADGDDDAAEQARLLVDAIDASRVAEATPVRLRLPVIPTGGSSGGAGPRAERDARPGAKARVGPGGKPPRPAPPPSGDRAVRGLSSPARAARPQPPARPRRPGRAGPRPGGGSPRGPRR